MMKLYAMRTAAILALAVLFSSGLSAQWRKPGSETPEPFGFRRGMTKAEVIAAVGAKAVVKDEGDTLILSTAPKPHPDFNAYSVVISPTTGVAYVRVTHSRIHLSKRRTRGDQ
jgi:hypothetical protein